MVLNLSSLRRSKNSRAKAATLWSTAAQWIWNTITAAQYLSSGLLVHTGPLRRSGLGKSFTAAQWISADFVHLLKFFFPQIVNQYLDLKLAENATNERVTCYEPENTNKHHKRAKCPPD